MRRALIAWAAAGAGDFSIDALKKEAKSLMIPGEKQLDYVCAQILRIKEHELELERKEAQKQLELERKEAQKQLELELERKEAPVTGGDAIGSSDVQSNSRGSSGWSGVSFAQCQRGTV